MDGVRLPKAEAAVSVTHAVAVALAVEVAWGKNKESAEKSLGEALA